MATQTEIDYALMAGYAYRDTRADINRFPIPQGWMEKVDMRASYPSSGFEAYTFQHDQRATGGANEIVISFAGTASFSDMVSDVQLAFGKAADQLKEAAAYYLSVKKTSPDAVISFTGHSLGGGLASLMAVFFNKTALTFDPAPFANAADAATRDSLISYLKITAHYTDAELATLAPELSSFTTLADRQNNVTGISVAGEMLSSSPIFAPFQPAIGTQMPDITHGVTGVSDIDLHAQALLTAFLQSDVSAPVNPTTSQQETFRAVTAKLNNLGRMIFDSALYAAPTSLDIENFLDRLVRHQVGVTDPVTGQTVISQDAMLNRFTADMWKLAQDGGLTVPGNLADTLPGGTLLQPIRELLNKALIVFAMQKYYDESQGSVGVGEMLFKDISGGGGIQFDFKAIAASWDKTKDAEKTSYFKSFLDSSLFTATESTLIKFLLSNMQDWYVQAGASGMNATDTNNRGAFMLGGTGADALVGGTAADLLIGNAGADTLQGGQGHDTLLGGAGNDIYKYNAGDGLDTILDTGGQNTLAIDGNTLAGGDQYGDARVHKDANGHLYVQADPNTLLIDGNILIQNYGTGGTFGLTMNVAVAIANPTTTNPIQLTALTAADQILTPTSSNITLHLGNEYDNPNIPVYQLVYESNTRTGDYKYGNAGAADPSYHQLFSTQGAPIYASAVRDGNLTAASDHLIGSAGDDRIYATTAADRGGNDIIEAGAGHDQVVGGQGDDAIGGGADSDILEGNSGNDRLYADAQTGVADAIAAGNLPNTGTGGRGDWLAGGDGSDTLVGSTANDVLMGGTGADLLIAGAGNDDIMGDTNWVATRFEWTVADQPDSTRYFYPANSNAQPTDGAADVIYAGDGADHVWGELGNDVVFGEGGADILQGDVTITRLLNGDLSFGINGSTDQITDQMRRRTQAAVINGSNVSNDSEWRDAA